MRPPLVEFHDVTVAYGRRPVIWNVDLTIDAPCLFGIMGPNGAGKSTLVKAALGLVPLAGGSVRFFGEPFGRVRGRVGYVPQRETVDWDFPVSVMEVVLMGTYPRLGWLRRPGRRERQVAIESLDRVALADVADRQIGKLSGGQQQSVFLARALAQEPEVYVLDEPMTGVDARSQETIFRVLAELRDAAEWFDRVALVDMRLVATGPTASVLTAENLERTYAGRLEVLDELGRAIAARGRTS